jgi:hypothetical protein
MNGPGDVVTAVDPRTLITATNAALDWSGPPLASRFPDYGDGCETESCSEMSSYCSSQHACCNAYQAACVMNGVLPSEQIPFERGVGMFLRNSERGFRGLDFQARLVWENRYGACAKPKWVQTDFIDKIVTAASADPSMTLGDLVSAIKDRLIGEPQLLDATETAALEATFGGKLDQPVTAAAATPARELCGALLESPQFLLQGIAGRGGEPRLVPADASYETICAAVAPIVGGTCTGGKLALQSQ